MVEGPTVILPDLPCTSCGYNLRMSPADSKCPECGNAISQTLAETSLRWGPAYLRRISRCTFWIALLAIAIPIEYIGGMLSRLLFTSRLPSDVDFQIRQWFFAAVFLVLALLVTAVMAFVWCASADPPTGQRLRGHKYLLRTGAVAFALGAFYGFLRVLVTALYFNGPSGSSIQSLERWLDHMVFLFPILLSGLALIAERGRLHMADIDRRTGNGSRVFLAHWSMLLLASGFFILMLVLLLMFILDATDQHLGNIDHVASIIASISGGAATLGLIATLIALFKFSGRMKKAAVLAQTINGQLTGPAPTADHVG